MDNKSISDFSEKQKLFSSFHLKLMLGGRSDVWLWRHRDELPKPIRFGERKFYLRDEVEAYLAKIDADRLTAPAPKPVGIKPKSKTLK